VKWLHDVYNRTITSVSTGAPVAPALAARVSELDDAELIGAIENRDTFEAGHNVNPLGMDSSLFEV